MPSVNDRERSLKMSALNQMSRNALRKMPAILLLAPGIRRLLLGLALEFIDRTDLRLHVRSGTLHLNGDCVDQRLEGTRIVRKTGDKFAALHRSRHHNFLGEALDRQIGGIEDVAVRVDDAIDSRCGGLRPSRYGERCFAGQRDAARDKVTPTHCSPLIHAFAKRLYRIVQCIEAMKMHDEKVR